MPKKRFIKKKNPIPKKVGFGMRYQGNPNAFPFKSPYKQLGWDWRSNVAQAENTGGVM